MKKTSWLLPSTLILIISILLMSSYEFIPIINNFIIATLLISYILTIVSIIIVVFKINRLHKLFKFLFSASITIFGAYLFLWIFIIASTSFSQAKVLEYNNTTYYYELKKLDSDAYIVSKKTGPITRETIFHKYTNQFKNPRDSILNEENTIKIIKEIEQNN